jgi:hypothetical protein
MANGLKRRESFRFIGSRNIGKAYQTEEMAWTQTIGILVARIGNPQNSLSLCHNETHGFRYQLRVIELPH